MTGVLSSADILSGIPEGLRAPLIEEYNKLVRNFREGRWEPSELSGGKLCEIVYSILRGHIDGSFPASPSKPPNMVRECQALENATAFPRSVRIQIPRMLIALYEVRNNRNVGHVGADVDPSRMDATLVLHMASWIMAELVRLFHNVNTDEATRAVETLIERIVPLIWKVAGRNRVLSSTLSVSDKTLVLLYAAAGPVPARELIADLEYGNPSRYRKGVLTDAHKAHLLHFDAKTDEVTLSPLGVTRVETVVPPDFAMG